MCFFFFFFNNTVFKLSFYYNLSFLMIPLKKIPGAAIGFLKYEFYNKLLGGVTLIQVTPGVN